jgi:curved DNA-binding protein CbpA
VSAFEVLGIPPTLDLTAIKTAYFAAITKTPPHVDAARFRRVRDAYEALLEPGARARAFLEAPVDPALAIEVYRKRYGTRLVELRREAATKREATASARAFARFAATTPLSVALARCKESVA